MPKITSSAIASAEYDPDTRELQIQFHSMGLYTYYGVPKHIFDGLLSASSAGKFFNDNIRYQYTANR